MRAEKQALIDTTLLGIWNRAKQPEAPSAPVAAPAATAVKPMPPAPRCLQCSKPPKAGSCFCSAQCKTAWQAGINRWHRSLPKGPIDDAPTLF